MYGRASGKYGHFSPSKRSKSWRIGKVKYQCFRASGCERFEKNGMALWRRIHSYTTMNLNFPKKINRDLRGALVFTAFGGFKTMVFFCFRRCTVTSFKEEAGRFIGTRPRFGAKFCENESNCTLITSRHMKPNIATKHLQRKTYVYNVYIYIYMYVYINIYICKYI